MKVLVIEDSELLRERFVNRISQIVGINTACSEANALAAADFMRRVKPDVVLLDIHQLHDSGINIEKDIKNGKPIPKIILMTDHPKKENHVRFKKAGGDFVFNKSFELKEIIETLKQLNEELKNKPCSQH